MAAEPASRRLRRSFAHFCQPYHFHSPFLITMSLPRFPVNGAGYRPRIYCVQILPDSAMHPKRHRPLRANRCQWTAYFLTSLCLSKGLASKP